MSVQALSFLLVAIISAALAVAILIRGLRYRLYVSFGVLSGVLFLYYLTAFLFGVTEDRLWYRLSVLSALAIPPTALRFFTIFLGQGGALGERGFRGALVLSLLLTPFTLSSLVLEPAFGALVLVFVFASLLLCMLMIIQRLRGTMSRVESARLQYLLYGGLVAVLLSLSHYLPVESGLLTALGNVTTIIYMYFLSQIIIQFRLLDLNELVGKMIVLATLVTLLATIYSLIGLFVSDIPGLIFFNTFIAGMVMMILFEPVRGLVENRVNRLLFRERYEFGRQLAMLRRELANVIDVERMCELVLTRLENSRRVTGASVYLLSEGAPSLRCLGYVGPPPIDPLDAVAERPFLDRLRSANALVLEPLEAEIPELVSSGQVAEGDALSEVVRVLESLEADVCIGLISEDRVLGLLNVRDQRMRDSYSPEEIAHLIAIANQATISVENSRILTSLRDRDRLVAVGEMAAGLAHEVRNPLGAIKGAAQMLVDEDEPGVVDSGTREFLEIIVEEVNRLDRVVSAFLDYAKPYGGTLSPTDANAVIGRVATLLRGPAAEHGVEVILELQSQLPPARIDPEVLRQVLWNLALNAIDAMESAEERRLVLRTRLGTRMGPLHAGYFGKEILELEVSDTGCGISPSDLDRIFIPFYTTKGKGTGLGLAICHQLVRAAGGTIGARSEEGAGTTFAVRLPLWIDESTTASSERPPIAGAPRE